MNKTKNKLLAVAIVTFLVSIAGYAVFQNGNKAGEYPDLKSNFIPFYNHMLIVDSDKYANANFAKAKEYLLLAKEQDAYAVFKTIADTTQNELERASCLNGMGVALALMSRYKEAQALFSQASDLYIQLEGEMSIGAGISFQNTAAIYFDEFIVEQALKAAYKAEHIFVNRLPPDHPNIGAVNLLKGYCNAERSKYTYYKEYFRPANRIMKNAFGADDVMTSLTYLSYADRLRADVESPLFDHNMRKVRKIYRKHQELIAAQLGENHPFWAYYLYQISWTYLQAKEDIAEVEINLKRAEEIYKNYYGTEHMMLYRIYDALGVYYKDSEQYEPALKYYKMASDIICKVDERGVLSRAYAYSLFSVGNMAFLADQPEDGFEAHLKALYILKTYYDEEYGNAGRYSNSLKWAFEHFQYGDEGEIFEDWLEAQMQIQADAFHNISFEGWGK